MISNDDPAALRARAAGLRDLAVELERTPAMSLGRFAGPDTWRSPRAEACVRQLSSDQARVLDVAEELRWTASRLERAAADGERQLARAPIPGVS